MQARVNLGTIYMSLYALIDQCCEAVSDPGIQDVEFSLHMACKLKQAANIAETRACRGNMKKAVPS